MALPAGEVWAAGAPSWESLPSMITPRGGHAATLLQDGRVLVAGGHGSDGTVLLREAELYDPASKTWAPAAPLPSALREVAATAVLPDGLALSTDGEHVEVYSPDLDLWSAAAPLTPALTAPKAVLLPGGKLMMLGGASGSLAGSIYDDVAGTWTPIRSLSGAAAATATLLQDGRVLAVNNGRGNIYDPETDSWTPTSDFVNRYSGYRATRLASGHVVFVGGVLPWNPLLSQLYLPEADLWVAIPGHDVPIDILADCEPDADFDRGVAVSLLPSGRVLLTGGVMSYYCAAYDENGHPWNEWHHHEFKIAPELYDPARASWVLLDVRPRNLMDRGYHTTTSLDDGSVLIAGGLVASGAALVPTASAMLFHERAPLGGACEAGGDCASGFCADSVCCDAACAGPCDACAASAGAAQDGVCTPLSGTPCDDTDACLEGGVCEAGTCAGGTPAPDGTPCNDGEVCSATSTCEGGACVAASAASCEPPDGCHEPPACDPALGCSGPAPEKPDGARCDAEGTPDAWQAAARMPNEMKYARTATLLQDGTVLVLGTEDSSGSRWRAMRYDPSIDRWQLIEGVLPVVRSIMYATLLQDGTVLVASRGRVDRFNPATGAWQAAAPMLLNRTSGTATRLQDGRVLVTGASDGSAEVYDPAADVWTLVAPGPAGLRSPTATLLQDGRVLVIGGDDLMGRAEVYDPAADVWTPVASMLSARRGHRATLLNDGRVLVLGGNSDGIPLATAELYDPASDTWTPAAEMAIWRNGTRAVLLADGRVLVTGNLDGMYSLDYTAELYDPSTDIWSPGPRLDIPLSNLVMARLEDGRVMMVGGELGAVSYPSPLVHLYVPGQRPGTGVCQAGVCLPSAGGEGGAGGSGGEAGGSGGEASGSGGEASGGGGSGGEASSTGGSGGDASGAGGRSDAASGGGVSGSGGSGDAASGAGGTGGDASTAGGGGTTTTSAGHGSGTGEGGSAGETGAQSGAGGGLPGGIIAGWYCQMGPGIQDTPTWLVLFGGLAALCARRVTAAPR
ncbi:hypothetical protein BE17_43255 [Sorangium cellulosum]|uniref:Uncharacterized protein n=1 Tax=Sorangium cellulosum TaxID=56 RepID=A0A150S5R5_SORCE|nr:hypothetical protein BE17_43255 [Sorangium cellulosum]